MKGILEIGDTFIDIGSNEGYFSVVASGCVGPSGRVFAVEPQRRLQGVIRRNLGLNGAENATVVELAISDKEGLGELNLSPSMNTGATSFLRRTRYSSRRQVVRTATLTEFLDHYGIARADLIKMDVEGWEYEAILGSREIFREGRVRAICLEIHDGHLRERGLSGTDIVNFLLECGYRYSAENDALIFRLPETGR